MFDAHYDLLTILYCCYMKNDFSYIKKIKDDFSQIRGVIANLYFMSVKKMKEELKIEDIDVFEMFKISTNLYREHFSEKVGIFSIEGCGFIKDTNELENLYHLGLRSILLVWNDENKYGSGFRSNKGLTNLGVEFIKKAVELGICIDLSHMNEPTFWDCINLLEKLKQEGYHPKVMASHSNSYTLCPHPRNLKDSQIDAIKSLGGIIGVVSYEQFINENKTNLEQDYCKHIKYMVDRVGIDSVVLATDNMDFATDLFQIEEDKSIIKHKTAKNELTMLLNNYYNNEEIDKLLFKNIENYFNLDSKMT